MVLRRSPGSTRRGTSNFIYGIEIETNVSGEIKGDFISIVLTITCVNSVATFVAKCGHAGPAEMAVPPPSTEDSSNRRHRRLGVPLRIAIFPQSPYRVAARSGVRST